MSIKLKKIIKNKIIKFVNYYLPFIKSHYYDNFNSKIIKILSETVTIISPLDTHKEVEKAIRLKQRGAYMRFGDGDAYLLVGLNDMLQSGSSDIANEMHESFALKDKYIYKSLSIHSELYGFEKEMYVGNHLVPIDLANRLLSYTFPFFVGHKIYSPICLHYCATYKPLVANAFLRLIKKNCICFIGNENTPKQIVEQLFGIVPHVKTPAKNAYDSITKIEHEAITILDKASSFGVVTIAMGCSGRILMKRLYKRGYNVFQFDFGSLLDGICGYNSRTWLKKENINYEILLKGL
jgi:hypothetical protein